MGNAFIGPAINAPPDLPFISFAERTRGGWTWKLPAVKRYVGERSVACSLTLIIRPDPLAGWSRAEYDELLRFAGAPSDS